MLAAGREFVAPGELGAVEPAARGEFPFGFGRQLLAGPFGVGQRIRKGHVHDGMIVEPIDVALGAVGCRQSAPLMECPPLAPVAQVDGRDGGENTSEPA